MTTTEELQKSPAIARYLAELRAGLVALPAHEQDAILADISDHITAEVEALPTDADVHDVDLILQRLGSPATLAADAVGPASAVPAIASVAAAVPSRYARFSENPGYAAMTVLTLALGGVLFPLLGWLVGLVFLWTSRVFRVRDKVIGTLVLPGGFGFIVFLGFLPFMTTSMFCSSIDNGPETCVTDGRPLWVGPTVFAILVLAQIFAMIFLYRSFAKQLRALAGPRSGELDRFVA